MNIITRKYVVRFWEKVDKNKSNNFHLGERCWEWTGGRCSQNGYGAMSVNTINNYAHRLSWMIERGEIQNGLHVLHHCDNPLCVNPKHLFLGTHRDNMNDRDQKGRNKGLYFLTHHQQRGEENQRHKLTYNQVCEIRKRWEEGGISQRKLGKEYGVSGNQVNLIVRYKCWEI